MDGMALGMNLDLYKQTYFFFTNGLRCNQNDHAQNYQLSKKFIWNKQIMKKIHSRIISQTSLSTVNYCDLSLQPGTTMKG